MNKGLSLYLDVLRVFAAFLVFLLHAGYSRLGGRWLGEWRRYGHDAVIIFFVLSGFVIAYVTATRNRGALDFAVARVARLWSVTFPALIIGFVLDHYGSMWLPEIYDGWWYKSDMPVWRFVANMTFVAQNWGMNIRAFSNGPMWSINYEAWYYFIFALAFFPRQRWIRAVGVTLACIAAGPSILILLPCWLLGVGVYHGMRKVETWPLVVGVGLFAGSFGMLYLYKHEGFRPSATAWATTTFNPICLDVFGAPYRQVVQFGRSFISDYFLSVAVAMNFFGAIIVMPRLAPVLARFEKPIRWIAGYTFVLYLLHYPLLHFYRATTERSGVVMLMTLQTILLLGAITEGAKAHYRRFLMWIIGGVRAVFSRRPSRAD